MTRPPVDSPSLCSPGVNPDDCNNCQIYGYAPDDVYGYLDLSATIYRPKEVTPAGRAKMLYQPDAQLMKLDLSGHPSCPTTWS